MVADEDIVKCVNIRFIIIPTGEMVADEDLGWIFAPLFSIIPTGEMVADAEHKALVLYLICNL